MILIDALVAGNGDIVAHAQSGLSFFDACACIVDKRLIRAGMIIDRAAIVQGLRIFVPALFRILIFIERFSQQCLQRRFIRNGLRRIVIFQHRQLVRDHIGQLIHGADRSGLQHRLQCLQIRIDRLCKGAAIIAAAQPLLRFRDELHEALGVIAIHLKFSKVARVSAAGRPISKALQLLIFHITRLDQMIKMHGHGLFGAAIEITIFRNLGPGLPVFADLNGICVGKLIEADDHTVQQIRLFQIYADPCVIIGVQRDPGGLTAIGRVGRIKLRIDQCAVFVISAFDAADFHVFMQGDVAAVFAF